MKKSSIQARIHTLSQLGTQKYLGFSPLEGSVPFVLLCGMNGTRGVNKKYSIRLYVDVSVYLTLIILCVNTIPSSPLSSLQR
jgi:hypothetical protein